MGHAGVPEGHSIMLKFTFPDTFEKRLFVVSCAAIIMAAITSILLNLMVVPRPQNAIAAGVVGAAAGIAWWRGRKVERPEWLIVFVVLVVGSILGFMWFSNAGVRGTVPFWMTPLFIGAAVVLKGLPRTFTLCALSAILVTDLTLEWFFPEWVTDSAMNANSFVDMGVALIANLVFSVVVGLGVANTWHAERERVETLTEQNVRSALELEASQREADQLRDMLPICAHCKNIRDPEGVWHPLEIYMREKRHTDLSHGICPKCLKEHY